MVFLQNLKIAIDCPKCFANKPGFHRDSSKCCNTSLHACHISIQFCHPYLGCFAFGIPCLCVASFMLHCKIVVLTKCRTMHSTHPFGHFSLRLQPTFCVEKPCQLVFLPASPTLPLGYHVPTIHHQPPHKPN